MGLTNDGLSIADMDVVYLLGVDDAEAIDQIHHESFVVYQGHHGDIGASRADVILPGAAYTEKDGIYVNTEGRVQFAKQATWPPGEAREDWKILRALSAVLGRPIPYDDVNALRSRIVRAFPHFAQLDTLIPAEWSAFGGEGKVDKAPFVSTVKNFYLTNVITKASLTMAKCSETLLKRHDVRAEAAE